MDTVDAAKRSIEADMPAASSPAPDLRRVAAALRIFSATCFARLPFDDNRSHRAT